MSARERSSRELVLAFGAVALACICGPALGWRAWSSAQADLDAAASLHAQTVADARRLEGLSRRRAVFSDQPRPEPDLVARIGAQVTAVGLDPALVTRVNVSAPRPVGDGSLRRQTAGVTMSIASPGDLARWLAGWAEAEPAWTVASVRLDRAGGSRSAPPGYTAALTLESLHRAEGAQPAGPSEVPP